MDDLNDFERLASALKPWLPELVVVGGWAHRLHHEHPLAQRAAYAPLRTRDADLAFGARAKLEGDLAHALRQAGFREELSSEETPPLVRYHLGTDDQGFYAEFVAPLSGSGTRRDGTADATLSRGGVVAQKLRHVDLLLIEPWRLSVGGDGAEYLPAPCDVLLANPVSFVVQKLLIHDSRLPHKRPQDVLYIHDTLQLFGLELDSLGELWRGRIAGALTSRQLKALAQARVRIFGGVTDVIRRAARIPTDRTLRPEDIRAACAQGLENILAGP